MTGSVSSMARTWFAAACFLGVLVLFCALLAPETLGPFLYRFPWLGHAVTWLRNLVR